MNEKKDNKERVEKMYEIIASIDHWLEVWNIQFPVVDVRVGVVIQRHAMRELAFIEYMGDKWLTMDELREKANTELKRLGQPIVLEDHNSSWPPPYTLPILKTRREELEDMDYKEVRKIFYAAKVKDTKKSRIDYILESEKEYK